MQQASPVLHSLECHALGKSVFMSTTISHSVKQLRPAGRGILAFVVLLLLAVQALQAVGGTGSVSSQPGAIVVTFNIAVDQGASNYVQKAAQAAISNHYDMIIVMNTPGGLLSDMLSIVGSIQHVESKGLNVYTYVPVDGMAASAGSYIALSTNAVYMGNGSIIGPSTPYVVGGSQSEQKHIQDAMTAYMAALAAANHYNVTAAVNMAQNNTAYDAAQAASAGLVTGLAQTFQAFLASVGFTGGQLHYFNEPLYDQFLSIISNSLVDGLLIVIGFVALAIDFLHQTVFLSVMAVVMIALGFLGAEAIGAPVVAILLLITAAILIFLEIKTGHGIFVTGGVAVGLFGTWLLAGNSAGYSPSPYGVLSYALMGAVGGLLVIVFIYLSRIRKILMSQPKLVDPKRVEGREGRMLTDVAPGREGVCLIGSEDWTCMSDVSIGRGRQVRVVEYVDGRVRVEELARKGG